MLKNTSHIKDMASNGVAVLARLASGTMLFVLMGRLMGPAAFGEFMAAMAAATLAAFFSNFGLSQQALREVAANPNHAIEIASKLASVKLWLTTIVVVVAVVCACVMGGMWWVGAILTLALVMDGIVEFLFALMKGRGQYDLEAGLSTVSAVVHVILVGVVCLITVNSLVLAAIFLLSRTFQCIAAIYLCSTKIPMPTIKFDKLYSWDQINAGWAYALDGLLAQLVTQLDTILVKLLLGAHAAGIYQAGMRIVTGMLGFSVIAGNVFIPRIAKNISQPKILSSTLKKMRKTYAGMVLFSSLGVWGIGILITYYGYGEAFIELKALWPILAVLVAIRIWSANYGVQLTAMGHQKYRSLVNFGNMLLMVILILIKYVYEINLIDVIYILVIGALFVCFCYLVRCKSLNPVY